MELRTCEFCGTEYDKTAGKCPLCGKSGPAVVVIPDGNDVITDASKRRRTVSSGGARLAKKEPASQNQTGWVVACIVLGLAVLIGLLGFLYVMGVFGNFTMTKEEEQLPEYNYENQLPETPEEPVEQPEEEETSDEEPVDGACTELTINQTEVTLDEVGDKFFLTAVAKPGDCIDPITFMSSDDTVATVSETGLITAVNPGMVHILVRCGEITQVCVVTCDFEVPEPEEEAEQEPEEEPAQEEAPPELPPELDKTDFTLFYPGEETTLIVKNAPEDAQISYISSNASVVTVTNAGKVTAVGDGDATITVTVGDTKLTCTARCRMDSTTEGGANGEFTGPFKLSHEDVTLFSSGESFSISLVDANGKKVNVGWFASNGSVSIVGSTIKAVSAGQATVSCVYNGKTYNCIVRCSF